MDGPERARRRGCLHPLGPAVRLLRVALSDREQAILDFERTWWRLPGTKDAAIREHFGLSGTRYYELVQELLDRPDALEYDPLVVLRLRRVRDRRRRARWEGRPTGSRHGR